MSAEFPTMFGIPVVTSTACERRPTAGEDGVRIVRHGLADVLEWLGEEVGPRSGQPIHLAFMFDGNLLVGPRVAQSLRSLA